MVSYYKFENNNMKFDKTDAEFLRERGIEPEKASEELEMIQIGFPYLEIEAPAVPGNGIFVLGEKARQDALKVWTEYLDGGGDVLKFVPASGAATRMFKELHSFLSGNSDKPKSDFLKTFFSNIHKFAFFRRLNLLVTRYYQKNIDSLIKEGCYKDIVRTMLSREGLNYGSLPKALVMFHIVPGTTRTALEEHLAEAAAYAVMKDGRAKLHFTVSPEHVGVIALKIEEIGSILSKKFGIQFEIDLSTQKPSTDTIAADLDGKPFRCEDGTLLLRPGGHGALIENLNDMKGGVIFIKNIDNVVNDEHRGDTILYKKVIGGVLVGVRQKISGYMRELESGIPSADRLEEMIGFLRKVLCVTHDSFDAMTDAERVDYLKQKFNRPIRVCGMVRNEGEPGGGPFMVYAPDGTVSPQILESTQIDPDNKKYAEMLRDSTHFNPVDLVCSIVDWKGEKFDLGKFVDQSTCFVSSKSKDGRELKALELPGLWNGAMSDWNTIFVEVPVSTFNPVKHVNDLLRPAHQSE